MVDSLGGLDAVLSEGGQSLSVGQRHLFCLARAVLNHKQILALDEVSANIDQETERVLDELMATVFKNCTILHIAHKLDSIRNYDKVLVMDEGKLLRFESMEEYLAKID